MPLLRTIARLTITLLVLLGLGVALAAPAAAETKRFPTATGTGAGFTWNSQGPDQRHVTTSYGRSMRWRLQLGLSGTESIEPRLVSVIAAVNALSPGIPQTWAGRTARTEVLPTAEDAWLVRVVDARTFAAACGAGTHTLGCAQATWRSTDAGVTRNNVSCRILIDGEKYLRTQAPWDGVLRHELGHCLGLGHHEGAFEGAHQLMRAVVTTSEFGAGDRNGIRALTRRVGELKHRPRRGIHGPAAYVARYTQR